MKKVTSFCIIISIIIMVTGCASTGTGGDVSYSSVPRESSGLHKVSKFFGGLLYFTGGALDVLSGNPVGIVNGISDMSIRTYGEFNSINNQTMKIETKEDGSLKAVKPID